MLLSKYLHEITETVGVDLRYRIRKETYSFHYQDRDDGLIFRYDNADHKPSPGFADHKHSEIRLCGPKSPT